MMSFKVFGVAVNLSFWVLIPVTFSLITAGNGQRLVLLCLTSALVHETGHLIFIALFRGKPDKISLNLFEIKIISDANNSTRLQDVIIISAGVVSNFAVALLSLILGNYTELNLFSDFASCNFSVGFLNVLPLNSFDGGQLLYLLLSKLFSVRISCIVLNATSIVLLFPLLFAGVYVLLISRHNFSLLFVCVYLLSVLISKELR